MLFFLCPRHTSLQPLPGGSGEGAGAPLLLLPSFQIFQLEHRLSSGLCCFLRSSYASTTQRLKRGTGKAPGTGAVLCLGLLSASCCSRASKAANISHFVALGARHFQRSNVLPVLWAGAEEQTRALGPTIVSSA